MFCKNCGFKIDDSTKFCPECGNKIEMISSTNENETPSINISELNGGTVEEKVNTEIKYDVNTKEGTIKLLNDIRDIFGRFRPYLDEINRLNDRNDEISSKNQSVYYILLFLSIVSLVLGIPFVGLSCTYNGAFMIVPGIICLALAFILLLVMFSTKTKYLVTKEETEELAENEKRIDKIYETIGKRVDECVREKDIFEYYPQAYFDVDSFNNIKNYVDNGRADSLKEAINLYETEMHQQRLENQQGHIINLQEQTLSISKNIEQNTKDTANAAKVGAIFSGITAYNTIRIKDKAKNNKWHL